MAEESRRATPEIFTKAGGIFWGIVLLVVGLLWLLAALRVIQVSLDALMPLVVVLAGIYLIVTKFMGSPFPPRG
ncbi:MAG: LiaI-LiaF-like domain-containing protein [Thermoplasmata archaeon]